jgi:hypothetical protein
MFLILATARTQNARTMLRLIRIEFLFKKSLNMRKTKLRHFWIIRLDENLDV